MALSRRNRATLAAVTRTLVPAGGSIPQGADDLDLVRKVTEEIEGYPPRAHRRTRLLLFAIEHLPVVGGHVRRFSRLDSSQQHAFLERTGRHPRSALRRLIVSYLKQAVYAAYLSQPQVEAAIGYRYECLRPRGIESSPDERVHH